MAFHSASLHTARANGVMLSLNTPSPGGGRVINMHHSVMDVSYQRSQQKHRKGEPGQTGVRGVSQGGLPGGVHI